MLGTLTKPVDMAALDATLEELADEADARGEDSAYATLCDTFGYLADRNDAEGVLTALINELDALANNYSLDENQRLFYEEAHAAFMVHA